MSQVGFYKEDEFVDKNDFPMYMMWDGGEIRVCGGDFIELGKNSGIGDWIWSRIAARILALPPDSI